MKKFIFLENDDEKRGMEDFDQALNNIEVWGELPPSLIEEIEECEKVFNLYHLSNEHKNELLESIMREKKVVITYSMYTANHMGSLYTLQGILNKVGRNRVDNLIYISTSSYLHKALEMLIDSYCKTSDDLLNLCLAVNLNNLVSCSHEGVYRLKVTLDDKYNYVTKIPLDIIDLNSLLS